MRCAFASRRKILRNPGQDVYKRQDGKLVVKTEPGYATELVTQKSLKWLDQRDKDKPVMLVVGHKAPHRCWCPSIQNLGRAKRCV